MTTETGRDARTTTAGTSTGSTDAATLDALRRLWTRPAAGISTDRTPDTSGAAITDAGDTSTGSPSPGEPDNAATGSTTATGADTTTDRLPGWTAAFLPVRCRHSDRADWLDEPDTRRPGYIRTVCRRCGGFVGYRPTEAERKRGRNPKP